MELLEIAVGAAVIWAVMNDVFQSVVVPRPTPGRFRPSALLVRGAWRAWRGLSAGIASPDRRERRLAVYAPLVLVVLLALWLALLVVGYALVFHGLRGGVQPVPADFATAAYFAGVSLLTIGFGDIVPVDGAARGVAIAAGATGLGVVALTITYLFTLYAAFQRRELLVVTLDARAGAPPSSVRLLETCARLGMRADLERIFARWEEWSAEVLESHLAHPILAYFRSTHDNESWVSALGAVLDAAAIVETTVEDGPRGQAGITRGIGTHLVEDITGFLRIASDGGPGVERAEFDAARTRLRQAGYRLLDANAAWRDFVALRSGYAGGLNALARHFAVPPAQWIGDRSPIRHGPQA